jgi:hypothetical protein
VLLGELGIGLDFDLDLPKQLANTRLVHVRTAKRATCAGHETWEGSGTSVLGALAAPPRCDVTHSLDSRAVL